VLKSSLISRVLYSVLARPIVLSPDPVLEVKGVVEMNMTAQEERTNRFSHLNNSVLTALMAKLRNTTAHCRPVCFMTVPTLG